MRTCLVLGSLVCLALACASQSPPPPPEVPAATCGDGLCSGESETCDTCPDDCGACELCGDGVCATDVETCASCEEDCGACDACGDELCDERTETCESCAQDCGKCSQGVCGDGTCAPDDGETCSNCGADCGPCVTCGNGVCELEQNETCGTCATDCGPCNPCGDDVCDATLGETCTTCPVDCGWCDPCGDGVCDQQEETCETCPADCQTCPKRQGCVQGQFNAFHGNFHAHTGYSDGVQTPAVAFAAAKQAKLDFLWVTDHKGPLGSKFADCRAEARQANQLYAGAFVAGCGYEVDLFDTNNTTRLGHFNALFLKQNTTTPKGLQDMYATLKGCDPCVGQWNHPPWPGTFANYQYFPVGDSAMRLVELNGGGDWSKKMGAYFEALRNGWHVSPAFNEDNHQANWGASPRATGVWATELTNYALREAVRANRTFATNDDTARITFKADGACWMGSRLKGLGEIEFTVVARDSQNADGFKRIDLLGKNGTALESKLCAGQNPCSATFTRKPNAKTFWVAQAVQTDGDIVVSAPIWLEP